MGPRAKLRKDAESACSIELIAQFVQAGDQLNSLKNCDSSLRSAASGIRRWDSFCDLAGRPRCPPTEEGVLEWPSFFGAGRSSRICISHLEGACPLLGVSTTWKSKAVLTAGHGLVKAGDLSRNRMPAVPKD